MEKRWMLTPITLLGLSLVVNVPTPAQNTGSAAQESNDQMKKKAAAQKKAAEAKEKWIKAQENTKEQTRRPRQGQTGARADSHCSTGGAGCTRKTEATGAVVS